MTTNTPTGHDIPSSLVSPAWLIGGLRNVPGWLAVADARLAFVSDGPVFDIPLAEAADITWPWWWFGGGLKLTAAGKRYKITFIRPNGMPAPQPSLLDSAADVLSLAGDSSDLQALAGLGDISTGRAVAKQWKVLLPPAQR